MIPLVLENLAVVKSIWYLFEIIKRENNLFGRTSYERNCKQNCCSILFLEAEDPEKDIYMYINSPGGSVYDGLGIFDTMQHVKPDIHTVCVGLAASMGAFLLVAGTKGKEQL